MAVMSSSLPVSPQEYVDLRRAVGWASPPLDVVSRALASTVAWAVERDATGSVVGLARAVGDGIYVLVVDVMVHPQCQADGMGRRLMETLLRDPVVAAARHTTLFAVPEVAGFYEALGMNPLDGVYFHH